MRARARNGNEQVEAVEQCPRELVAVRREARRGAGALGGGITPRSARTQIHGRHELESRGEDDPAANAGDRDRAVLEWLPQCLERVPGKLGELVEK